MQMEDDEIEAEAAEEQEDSSGPRNIIWKWQRVWWYSTRSFLLDRKRAGCDNEDFWSESNVSEGCLS